MGYPRRACAEALKQANNYLEEASEMLLTNIDVLVSASEPVGEDTDDQEAELMDDATQIPQLMALGAEYEEARGLLRMHGNQLDRAADEFLQKFKDSVTANTERDPTANISERERTVVEKRGRKKKHSYFFKWNL